MRRRPAAAGAALALAALAAAADAAAGARVWVVDDGEKVRQDATSTALARGEQNPVWRPGEAVRVFAMRNESIALQVVVEADDAGLDAVTVDVGPLAGPEGTELAEPRIEATEAAREVGRPIERFVEWSVPVRRASGGATPGESLGWAAGAAPPASEWVGPVPDALVPVEIAAGLYPMRLPPRSHGIVWVDVNVPADQPPGSYAGAIEARDHGGLLASIPVSLEVVDARLPDQPVRAVLYYDPEEVARRVGPGAETQLWKLLHAHRIAPLHDARTAADLARQCAALDGSLYTPAARYRGPGLGAGDGVVALGAYGGLGDPSATRLASLAGAVAAVPASTEVFVYADDEHCSSPRGAGWSAVVAASTDPRVHRVRVGWTCADDPAGQPVDIPMLEAGDYEPRLAARATGKEVWIYNGVMPRTGTFLLDASAVSPRVNGWIGEMFGIPHWLYWESTYWYGRHGLAPIDPFVDAESFHGDHGDWANGDGVLLYPGRQIDAFSEHSFGFEGVLPSIRLKNWRRGLEDAGYLRLARARDARRADAIANALIPGALRGGGAARWSPHGQAFYDARKALLAVALGPAPTVEAPRSPWWLYAAIPGACAIAFVATRRRWRRARR
jgi:hypothetical protein